ncbi:membrane protein insertion efficiency factor YidD [Luminiphilus syltensis]|uniref:membrane protein insertion efficiency factor YidD n=1 Tax=Luminiphilus syltensis TaxID=1341119 RepID=UPI003899014F
MRTALFFLLGLPRRLALALIDGYRYFISPFFAPSCRFSPTCSSYARTAILEFGLVRGLSLTIKRLGRCHPWCDGGYDPVPKNPRQNTIDPNATPGSKT